ncbi:hypothetical protein AB0O05_03340 [Streptomyces sp. NPDC093084]|uniref:hypothetical protein n=1 Tax=Streptomyces sp. NPDC093084 TaxID=3155197 RepID=UPI003428FF39
MTKARRSAWGAFGTVVVLALSACSSQGRAASPKEVRELAGSAEAVQARQETEGHLRDVVRAYDDHTPLVLGMVVVRDTCLAGRGKQWFDSNGDDQYKIRCSMLVTAYYGADRKRIAPVLDGVLTAGERTGSAIPFTHDVYGQFVDYYRGRGGRAEVPEMSLPGHTLSWDPVRDRESYLMVEEPDSCPVGEVPVTRCVREPAEETVAAVRERYGMVFKLELGSPEYYKVSR